eukprot:gb/GFBE01027848.1/.p1 GENE.gb/GFBE01027848.1/~~gb/GFBE01027848.1/.p1  ORF type:complete len:129 (+),score=34.26 gb/GFBE01027848.1/:1-387(+)
MMSCCCTDVGGQPVESVADAPKQAPLVAAADLKDPKDPNEFQVVVTKSPPDSRIGLDISAIGGKVLKVWKVKEGLVDTWNKGQSEENQVKAGDAVMEVNGNRGSSDKLLQEVSKATTLTMVFSRGKFA